jgi:hypothetical protein
MAKQGLDREGVSILLFDVKILPIGVGRLWRDYSGWIGKHRCCEVKMIMVGYLVRICIFVIFC